MSKAKKVFKIWSIILTCLILGDILAMLLPHGFRHNKSAEVFTETQSHVIDGDVPWVVAKVTEHPELKLARDSWDQSTLLHLACTNVQHEQMVAALLGLGFDPNAINDHGQTPLHLAYEFSSSEPISALLLKAGADPNLKDKSGKSPADYRTKSEQLASWRANAKFISMAQQIHWMNRLEVTVDFEKLRSGASKAGESSQPMRISSRDAAANHLNDSISMAVGPTVGFEDEKFYYFSGGTRADKVEDFSTGFAIDKMTGEILSW